MKAYQTKTCDILIIGAGGAGLRAAIEASRGGGVTVAVLSKSLLGKAHTVMAEGGVAAALGNVDAQDNWKAHFRDTMKGGSFLNQWRMVEIFAQEAPERVQELEQWGAVFDRTQDGLISQRPFGGHSYARLAHVGDRTGLELIRTLQDYAIHRAIDFFMEYTVVKLFTREGRVCGALAYNRHNGEFTLFNAQAVVLATGGCGRCFAVQTNSWETTGDGHALAYDAGAEMMDMEFMQFHPTGMIWPPSVHGVLVTEGVRGEGGVLKNSRGERFMFHYIPPAYKNDVAATEEEANAWVAGDRANNRKPPELLTRDVVARAILAEVRAGRGSAHGGAYLDIASVRDAEYIKRKLPSMYHQFLKLADVDITREAMEVGPTAHYSMGGVRVHPETTESSVRGLYAAGEVAAGLHGANRLGGNSLSDLLVFGKRAGEYAAEYAREKKEAERVSVEEVSAAIQESLAPFKNKGQGESPYTVQQELKEAMGKFCGIIRRGEEIQKALKKIGEIRERGKHLVIPEGADLNSAWHAALDLRSLLTVSELLARAALAREESRGAHTRDDFSNASPEWGACNVVLQKGADGGVRVRREPLEEMPERLREIVNIQTPRGTG